MPKTDAPAAPSQPRSRKGAQTRARLLEAAKTVFEDTGFLEARISDIAEEAGLSHGSFYHYFDSKEQIFREVAEQQEGLLTAPAEAVDDGTDPAEVTELERIRRANRLYLERYRDNGKIMGVIEEVSRYDDHVNEARMRRQKHFADRAERAIRRLQKDGEANRDIDPEIAALALGSMVARVAELWLIDHWGDYDLDTVTDQVTMLWGNALGLDRTPAKATKRS
jgi:AcrR family transcriptional regulator